MATTLNLKGERVKSLICHTSLEVFANKHHQSRRSKKKMGGKFESRTISILQVAIQHIFINCSLMKAVYLAAY
jgi:hypothetical protein